MNIPSKIRNELAIIYPIQVIFQAIARNVLQKLNIILEINGIQIS